MSDYDPNFQPTKQYATVGQKVVISNDQGQVLLLKRSEKAGRGGRWSLPGGGLDTGEESVASLVREITEETQVIVGELHPFYVKTYMNEGDFIVIIAYTAKHTGGAVVLNWEHDAYQWVDVATALTMDLTPDARDIITQFNARSGFMR